MFTSVLFRADLEKVVNPSGWSTSVAGPTRTAALTSVPPVHHKTSQTAHTAATLQFNVVSLGKCVGLSYCIVGNFWGRKFCELVEK